MTAVRTRAHSGMFIGYPLFLGIVHHRSLPRAWPAGAGARNARGQRSVPCGGRATARGIILCRAVPGTSPSLSIKRYANNTSSPGRSAIRNPPSPRPVSRSDCATR